MSWTKREAVSNLVVLGDEEGQRRKVGGLLVGTPKDKGYDKLNYVLVQQDGEEITLSGSASLARQINEQDIGKFVKCEFTGWGKSPNGKFKAIDVNVWEGEPTDVMKSWPRFAEFHSKAAPKAMASTAPHGDDDFPGALADEEDDLPFN